MTTTTSQRPAGLTADAVGLIPVVFQSVANMAPGASVAFSILFAAQYAGGATPLAVLIGLVLCLLVAVIIGQLAKHLPSAGGLYTYNARGLGTSVGFLVGWAFILAEVVACLTIGIFYLICYYAATVFFGPGRMLDFANSNAGDPWTGLSTAVWGLGFIALVIALVNSAIAGSNASSTATTRVGFAMGRIRMLPAVLTRINPRFGTPSIAVHLQAMLAIGYALVLGFALGGPLKALVLQGTISTILIVAIYICTGVSCVVFYRPEHRDEFNPLLHLLVPLVSSLAFIPVLLAAFGVDFGGLGIQPLASPASYAPYVVYVWMVLGVVVLGYFLGTDRSRIAAARTVFADEVPLGQ